MNAYIVEDHESMRIILRRLLKKNVPEISDIGESESAEKALEQIPEFSPQVVLVDISLPGMDGIEMIRQLKPRQKDTCFLVVTGHEIEMYEKSALEAGAEAIFSKYEDRKLLDAVKAYAARCS